MRLTQKETAAILRLSCCCCFPCAVQSAAVRACGRAVTLSLFAFITARSSVFFFSFSQVDRCKSGFVLYVTSPCRKTLGADSAERPALNHYLIQRSYLISRLGIYWNEYATRMTIIIARALSCCNLYLGQQNWDAGSVVKRLFHVKRLTAVYHARDCTFSAFPVGRNKLQMRRFFTSRNIYLLIFFSWHEPRRKWSQQS